MRNRQLPFFILLVMVLLDRLLLLQEFAFRFTDNDQLIYWQGVADYARGIFHEPYFYGQNYNYMLEALLAVPFYWAGLPIYQALPISSSILALLPFVSAAFIVRRKYDTAALIFLAIPLLLPVEYHMLSSLSRGFVSGLALMGFMMYVILQPERRSSFILFGVLTALGYILNPNSLLFSFPVGVYLLMFNFRKPKFYLYSAISAAPFLLIQFLSRRFYDLHTDYIVHRMWELDFSRELWLESFGKLDLMMSGLTPLVWFWGWSAVLFIAAIAIYLLRRNNKASIALLASTLFLLFTLGLNKIHDLQPSLFFAGSRMFLAMPLLLGLAIFWMWPQLRRPSRYIPIILSLCGFSLLVKADISNLVVKKEISNAASQRISREIKTVKTNCEELQALSVTHHAQLIVYVPDWRKGVPHWEFYNYGCPLLRENFPEGILNIYERRSWKFQAYRDTVISDILLVGGVNFERLAKVADSEVITTDPDIVIIRNNPYPLSELMDSLALDYKRFRY